ncbi:uncharacterized protein BDZ83DRAFT_433001 [Colletotrichum acutatum]|uniref:CCHC-type domain-containing protein n=1 Tax=Glomerella acutata TaxID=27357 RepID=A0AAD8XCK2_GLOAC|nr:uncharacterized protein BDZ83DRAFT_433001 [Colletotrichum acutatum]KAK1722277.1 hypothetical protein BDZ83DRAFT_433001 [Colletotrichum acutatum]
MDFQGSAGAPQARTCFTCGAAGHQARECPNRGAAKCATTAARTATSPAIALRSLLAARRSATSASSPDTSSPSAPTTKSAMTIGDELSASVADSVSKRFEGFEATVAHFCDIN